MNDPVNKADNNGHFLQDGWSLTRHLTGDSDGDGIPDSDDPRPFVDDRMFQHIDPLSESLQRPGAALGLAILGAVMAAHREEFSPEEQLEIDNHVRELTSRGMSHALAEQTAKDQIRSTTRCFERTIKFMKDGERVAKVRETLREDARQRGWQKESRISKKNNRDVFRDGRGSLWSIDTEKGRWEKTNRRGVHLGEYNRDLEQTADPDSTGEHDLEV